MPIVVTRDIDEFAAKVGPYLAAEPGRNIIATVLVNTQASPPEQPPLFAYATDAAGDATAAAIRTPPWPMLASGFDTHDQAQALIDLWLNEDPQLDAVNADTATSRAIATAWASRTHGTTRLDFSEAAHLLTAVTDPARPAEGTLRTATVLDRELLIGWQREFVIETGFGVAGDAARAVDRRLETGAQFVWERYGPVSTVGRAPTIAGTARIGPVYTPPEHRARGYATSAVAAICRRILAGEAERCMLFTDLANPTSNKIYASIGFERFGDWEEHRFIADHD
jgi:predicted GNAT family acetyltransferase